ncbi:DctP family TRAP transporter solute-binding subunit [Lysinibacillus odysseyi]|uniref:DctP family TRAP transporter solute-binding subunit n=1 Tax=Lysinibacillus odysseyi TaxID=202611 RepID=UPI000AB80BA6|nr:DctP family TRAP transporter solute-binding subunit [Lysinibacillus odysseyi]
MKKIITRSYCFLSICLFLLLLAGCQNNQSYPTDYEQLSEDERLVIRFSHVVGEDTPKGTAARKFAELVKKYSNGYIEVQVFANGTLYKDSEELEALMRGDIQMIAPATSKLTHLVPEISVLDLPYAFRSLEEVHDYLQSEVGQELTEKLQKHNLYSVGIWDSGFKQLSNNINPIYTFSDLKGLNMRIMPSDILYKQFEIAGANSKKIDFNTVFNELKKGSIDGQENTLSNISSKNLYSLQHYLTISDHGYLGYLLLFNYEFWNSLSPDVQAILVSALQEVQQWEWDLVNELNIQKQEEIEQCECVEIYTLPEEEKKRWEKAFDPVYDFYKMRYPDRYIKALPKFS